MQLPIIAIVGRPNVGKSTLLNAVAGRRVSVVDPTEGVTRDRVSIHLEHGGAAFELMDTGGIGIVDVQDLSADVERQIAVALDTASVIVFVVDGRAGLTPFDQEIARRLQRMGRPVLLAANKCESRTTEDGLGEFARLGFGDPVPLSAQNRMGTRDLLDAAVALLPPDRPSELPREHLKVAIVGRRNADKSTLTNAIARSERVIVSEKPGTTRDAVDVWVERDGEHWILIDTAGITTHAADGRDPIQWYSEHRAFRAVRRADVVILLLDATRDAVGLERRIAREVYDAGKPCLLVANKWDLVDGFRTGEFEDYYRKTLPHLARAPLAFVSAKNRMNVQQTLDVCRDLHAQSQRRLGTGELNRFVKDALDTNLPKPRHGKTGKILYAAQVGVSPPTVVLHVNDPRLFDQNWRRYLENRFRDTFDFSEVPVRIEVRERRRKALAELKGGTRKRTPDDAAPDDEPLDDDVFDSEEE